MNTKVILAVLGLVLVVVVGLWYFTEGKQKLLGEQPAAAQFAPGAPAAPAVPADPYSNYNAPSRP
jgi:uncharacterized membrane protein YphA (DoxX/SURF4 family)